MTKIAELVLAGKQNISVTSTDAVSSMQAIIGRIPTTRYYGSKRKLLSWIYTELKELPFNTVLDGFGGTASVSVLFKAMGKQVIYNDALKCNTIIASALLNTDFMALSEGIDNYLLRIVPYKGFISKSFQGMYYTSDENEWLDGAAQFIMSLRELTHRNILYYCLFQACLQKRPFNLFHRANLYLRLNIQPGVKFGNLTTWNTPFPVLCRRIFQEVLSANITSHAKHIIMPPGDVCAIASGFDLVYLDPPYCSIRNSGDDYLMRYHFLEGLSHYDNWKDHIDWNSTRKTINSKGYINEWSKRLCYKEKLYDLIHTHRKSIVVLSYVENAYPSVKDIEMYFKSIFKTVITSSREVSRALSVSRSKEVLIIGIP